MRSGIRFDPPEIDLSAGLSWILQRAFGPPIMRVERSRGLNPGEVVGLARRFSLAERIGSRMRADVLEDDLGKEGPDQFLAATTNAAVLSIAAGRVCREIAELALEIEVPVIFLKGAALQLAGTVACGSRDMCDIDVLTTAAGATRLQRALVGGGCVALQVPESEHQLQFLTHATGLGIEVHRTIPGLRIGYDGSATASCLLDAGLYKPAPGLPDGSFVPSDDALLAHLLVHGIAQHGLSPQEYPMARMLADVQDLGIDEAGLAAFLAGGFSWIAADVFPEEVAAAAGLVWRLGVGQDPAAVVASKDGVGALLRHLLAGAMDERYSRSMKFSSLTAMPGGTGGLRALAKTVRSAMLPTRAQIDILYGPPRTGLGYLGWHIWRPIDLVMRAVRYGRAWVQHRFRIGN